MTTRWFTSRPLCLVAAARRVVARSILAILVPLAGLLAPTPPATLAAPSAGVYFQGTLSIGAAPAPPGSLITVLVARSVDDVTICGTGQVTGPNGQYRVDSQATPPCVNSATSRSNGPFMFVASGENVGGCACVPNLENPATLGRTLRVDLRGTPISVSAAGADEAGRGALSVPAVRLWGTLTRAGTPALSGTPVDATASRTQAACGHGVVIDDSGTYWLDVPATDGCTRSTAGGNPGAYLLTVDGEQVGGCACPPTLDQPLSLGHTIQVDLRGELAPRADALLRGGVAATAVD